MHIHGKMHIDPSAQSITQNATLTSMNVYKHIHKLNQVIHTKGATSLLLFR